MAGIKIFGFAGEIPLQDPRYLPPQYATEALNLVPWVDYFEPFKKLSYTASLSSVTPVAIYYKYGQWLTWDVETDIADSPIPGDTRDSLFFTNATGFKVLTTATVATPKSVGVPPPTAALTFSGTGSLANVFYRYTYVNEWGQESEPSIPYAPTPSSSTVNIPKYDNTLSPYVNVTKARLYRSDTFGTGYFFIGEVTFDADATESFVDNVLNVSEALVTDTWLLPPTGLSGLTKFNEACLAGFVGNRVYVSEPGVPYAWPLENSYVVTGTIVALGRVSNGLVVMTDKQVVMLLGTDPAGLVDIVLQDPYGCVAAKGVVQAGDVVVYPSFRGLVRVTNEGAVITTNTLFQEDEWQELNPETFRAFYWNEQYVAIYQDAEGKYRAFSVNFIDPTRGVYRYDGLAQIGGIYEDRLSGDVYMTFTGNVLKWNGGDRNVARWRSKPFTLGNAMTMRVIQVDAEQYPVVVKVYRNGVLQDKRQISNRQIHRLANINTGLDYQVEIESEYRVQAAYIGTNSASIAQVKDAQG